ncbi:helix-turn-helix domain-containing protein [Kibdelosporangium persicum]|uniref:Anaerobic benzoate catabolism transcriptional regulator n=1 Tax=Kibdelosporangium persicum TaxID=2698649 RepID=A0ABX2FC67_9PSEU|nr:helix-turn-helix domain-containing protein [Kibdelosporangium persicum]NRN68887.1 Anaerobic benzoate catabolism transcriptional regulator [Kibdelosporangium persicum]
MDQNPAPLSVISVIATSLQRERRRAGLSLAELARRAGVAKSTLSQLESGTGNPSIETLWALCVALDVTFAQLVEPPEPKVHVIRADEGSTIAAEHAEYVAKVLSASPPNARRDLYLITAQPGTVREAAPHRSGTYEHVVLSVGRALVGVQGNPVEIGPGDYIGYPADVPHVFEALEPDTVAVMVSEHV